MDIFEQPQPPQIQYVNSTHATHTSSSIIPCAVAGVDDFGSHIPSAFHLLSCGHIVVVDEGDKRCGRNCQHAAAWVASVQATEKDPVHAAQAHQIVCPPLTTTQSFDLLYCEVCQGIPFNRYKFLTTTEAPSILRRSFALTRPMMQSMLGLDHLQVHAMLSSLVFSRNSQDCDWRHIHQLLCGHEVYAPMRASCGYNCGCFKGCTGALASMTGRNSDVIVCQECVTRAELVYQRFSRFEVHIGENVDSGYVTAGR
ncbi:hypothetical protein FB567DRAFT_113842 [Paraphoma chrysanthemicola]|uniref:Uncharacterized protein n=1 Tax=Paraphoma chrysanthemicola TaxID=798071 RepID=A0A8K0VVC5_9PLEO|nr:hypothetical protein FB567DRAFT_113842 [Paraphoma chrysanthemicola]